MQISEEAPPTSKHQLKAILRSSETINQMWAEPRTRRFEGMRRIHGTENDQRR